MKKQLAGLGLVTALLALPACATTESNGDPTPSPTVTSSPTETNSPSPTNSPTEPTATETETGEYQPATESSPAKNVPLPEFDEQIKEPTDEGLLAAARYYFDALEFVKKTGSRESLDKIADPECEACFSYQADIEEWYEEGGWLISDPLSQHKFERASDADKYGNYRVNFQITEPGVQPVTQSELGSRASDKEMFGTLWLRYTEDAGQWQITDFEVVRTEEVDE